MKVPILILFVATILSTPIQAHGESNSQSQQDQIIESILFVSISNELKMKFDNPMSFSCVHGHSFKKTLEGHQFKVDLVASDNHHSYEVRMTFSDEELYGDWDIIKFKQKKRSDDTHTCHSS
ncbi:hypothetical protein [Shouchella hunanensis]|uniref:Uncharacterized protein n=1 Tax=Shouchella hunanensis TaxID=766894 RepID=A0ABY7W1S6_9BACI|nr:hypothetical protein [Shouchella hunanensis]WDF01996.1 hypothetical protein PQ477_10710 [Shouchella hunanensis]